MIVVCGDLERGAGHGPSAVAIASRATAAGSRTELVGIIPDGPVGDRRLIDLATSGIGHAAVLRTTDRPLEAADVELALRYLPDIRVVIAAGLADDLVAAAAAGAAFAAAPLVILAPAGKRASEPGDAGLVVTLEAPATDPDETFAGFVAAFAVRLDAGEVPADAWTETIRRLAVDPVSRPARSR
jgi:hypothetical protein